MKNTHTHKCWLGAACATLIIAAAEANVPWNLYPRPQMVRANWTCLNGEWDYAVTAVSNTFVRPTTWQGKIVVPFAIESKLSGVGRDLEPDEFLWYRRTINVSKKPGVRTLLHFDSVDFRAQAFLGHNELDVPHESMNEPWVIDVTDKAKDGENRRGRSAPPASRSAILRRASTIAAPASSVASGLKRSLKTMWSRIA